MKRNSSWLAWPFSLACGPYDRTRALADGRVEVDGVELRYIHLEPEEIFFRMLNYGEFDVAEMSLSTYLLTHLADGPFVAIRCSRRGCSTTPACT
jgi:4,5-dihydroxyphthalate decarboxylase